MHEAKKSKKQQQLVLQQHACRLGRRKDDELKRGNEWPQEIETRQRG
jgi:hypothetical protein